MTHIIALDAGVFCRISVEGITDEFKSLATSVHDLDKQVKDAPDDVRQQFQEFLQVGDKFCIDSVGRGGVGDADGGRW